MDLSETPRRLRELPSFVLTAVAASAGQLASITASELGASKAAFALLAVLDEFGPCSQAELGRRLRMDRRSVSEETLALQRAGLVTREPDPADPRRNRLELTPAGRKLLGQLQRAFSKMQERLLAPLLPAERRELERLLALLADTSTATSLG